MKNFKELLQYVSLRDVLYAMLAFAIALWAGIAVEMLDRKEAGNREIQVLEAEDTERKPIIAVYVSRELPIPYQAPEPTKPPYIRDDIPLSEDLQTVLWEACEEAGVEYAIGLALIEVESRFLGDAVSPCGAYGLAQLNPRYFPSGLSDEDNIKAGIGYLGELLYKHGDLFSALTAYNAGYDTGSRVYADKVLGAAEKYQ